MLPIPTAHADWLRRSYCSPQTGFAFDAMLAGNSPAEIFVGAEGPPFVSLLWDRGHGFYFGSETANAAQRRAAVRFFRDQLLEPLRDRGPWPAKIHYPSQGWRDILLEELREFRPAIVWRSLYRHELRAIPAVAPPLVGIAIRPIDDELLGSARLGNVELLTAEVSSMWGTARKFLESGFGYCAVAGSDIAGWCTAEYMSDRSCGIGIETVEPYQKQGIATATALVFLERCTQLHVAPYWDSWHSNVASIRVAEKAGFTKLLDYSVVFLP